ncbi:MAG TPA: hypothetical protein VKH42_15995 [Vicinamibacterales bacterium]|nr:hypothetical protein [Vicinamibacterales bacterium]
MTAGPSDDRGFPAPPGAAGPIACVAFVLALALAVSVDVVRAGYGVKGDEATYVGMALSMAFDHDLTYERRDLERFWGLYQAGPEGIFLKRGKRMRIGLVPSPPFVQITKLPDTRSDRLYFGKSFVYSAAAAPFVRLLGMNGFFVLHVLMLAVVCACGYRFLAARGRPGPAMFFTLAFLGASVVPAYAVFLTPELFNFTLVFVAYFFWLYKENGEPDSRWLNGRASDLLAAVLLGIAVYSKPINAPLVAPLVLMHWWRRRWRTGIVVGGVAVIAASVFFGINAIVSGEFNYQGGDRKTFYSAPQPNAPPPAGFAFDAPDATWEVRGFGEGTDELGAQDSLVPSEMLRLLFINAKYFLFGRHFGFVPYFFPGALALVAWVFSRERRVPWRLLTFLGFALTTLAILIVFPYTWSGGGGPPGNRYFMGVYPVVFFLMPPTASWAAPLLAWAGGALFTAKILFNPFVSAKFTWEITERGPARRLPIELTMANDLPVRLAQPLRAHIPYRRDPLMLLYFLDTHAFPPEPDGMWVAGGGRADIIVRTERRLDHFTMTVSSPIATRFTVSAGAASQTIALVPEKRVTFDVAASGTKGFRSYAYLMSAQSSDGFVPRLRDPKSQDNRNLGVQATFQAIESR